ncbi:MAG: hypothetical protein AMXMBFR84_06880 [Candidatus Hydrogenedentota bacterium]
MSIRATIQDAIKTAMKDKQKIRLECLRMVKGALLLKEKETGSGEVSDEDATAVLRREAKKRRETAELLRSLGKTDEAAVAEEEVTIIEEFLPRQLSAEALEAKVRAYLLEHPEVNHAGKLTGAMKKELGDLAEGKMLNEICQKVLAG